MRKPLHRLGIHDLFYYERGRFNAITDVAGVKVGHSTIIEGQDIRTGVTVVVPSVDFLKSELLAGGFVFNANGEVTGLQYIFEEGRLTSPIFLTNTGSVGDVFSAVIDYYQGDILLPVIGECWDGYLNDLEGRHVKKEHVVSAIEKAAGGQVPQGNVGAGTGMISFGFKAGIGTSSRKLKVDGNGYTVGALVNNNMYTDDFRHRYLRIGGMDVARLIGEHDKDGPHLAEDEQNHHSSILIIATDIPLSHVQLNRIARHAVLGIGRVGLVSYTGSGDFIIAFSTGNTLPRRENGKLHQITIMEDSKLDGVFEAVIEMVEEAYLNSLLMAEDMEGREGRKVRALPIGEILTKAAK